MKKDKELIEIIVAVAVLAAMFVFVILVNKPINAIPQDSLEAVLADVEEDSLKDYERTKDPYIVKYPVEGKEHKQQNVWETEYEKKDEKKKATVSVFSDKQPGDYNVDVWETVNDGTPTQKAKYYYDGNTLKPVQDQKKKPTKNKSSAGGETSKSTKGETQSKGKKRTVHSSKNGNIDKLMTYSVPDGYEVCKDPEYQDADQIAFKKTTSSAPSLFINIVSHPSGSVHASSVSQSSGDNYLDNIRRSGDYDKTVDVDGETGYLRASVVQSGNVSIRTCLFEHDDSVFQATYNAESSYESNKTLNSFLDTIKFKDVRRNNEK